MIPPGQAMKGGLKWVFGVPFVLVEPGLEGYPSAFSGKLPLKADSKWDYIFALVGDIKGDSRFMVRSSHKSLFLNLRGALTAIEGWPPLFNWRLSFLYTPIKGKIEGVEVENCLLFALTLAKESDRLPQIFSAIEKQKTYERDKKAKEKRGERIASYLKKMGKCAILPLPPGHNNVPPDVFWHALREGTIYPLSPEEFIAPKMFNPKGFPPALRFRRQKLHPNRPGIW